MKVHKFEGATMRDAVAKVKAELGDQAVIISTRQVRKGLLGTGYEISAAIEDTDEAPAFTSGFDHRASAYNDQGPRPRPAQGPSDADVEKLIAPLRTEMRSLRALVRAAGDSRPGNELKSEIAALRRLVEGLRPAAPAAAPAQARASAPARADTPLVAHSTGRIIMLVGPTGAGKTTTIAKLAARAALIEERSVSLITTDNYRIGGVDQIRAFADLIGVPLSVAETPGMIRELLEETCELTLIDTAGRSPREAAASIAELAALLPHLPPIEVHLVVPAAASPAAVDELVARYRPLAPARLLVTKLDEVETAPDLALAPGRTGLPITWVTTGQQVPEDLEEPTAARILELARQAVNALTTKRAA